MQAATSGDPALRLPRASSLERAQALLGAFDSRHQRLNLSALARRAALPKSTTHRLINRLVELGWLARVDGDYVIGTKIFELASYTPEAFLLREAAGPSLQELHAVSRATVQLAVADGPAALYVDKIIGRGQVNALSRVGGRMPLHCTAIGKSLLAFAPAEVREDVLSGPLPRFTTATISTAASLRRELHQVREAGLATDREEAGIGIRCISAPVFGPDGRVQAAVSVSLPAQSAFDRPLTAAVRSCAHEIERVLAVMTERPVREQTS
jgi:DNA-binding IclR family transcriptional regulator